MKIGFVWDGNYPWDVRVEKICLTLLEGGHEVHLVCRNTKYQPTEEIIDGIRIHRLPALKASSKLNQIVNFPFFFNPVWYWAIKGVFEQENVDLAIVRDITLSLTALWAARSGRIPMILDMAEPYPEMIRAQHAYGDLIGLHRLIRNARLSEWVELVTLKRVAMTFAMIEESRDRIMGMGIPEEKISIVSNTPDLRKFKTGRPTFPGSMGRMRAKTIFLYVGFLNLHRGLQVAIQGFPMVLKEEPNSVLFLVGSDKFEEHLRNLAKKLDIYDRVVFEGYKHHSLIQDYIASCDVGVIPHFSCGLWNHTIPNKLFDYMAMSKPVLSSDATPVKRIVEKEGCGTVYENNDPSAFAREAKKLLDRDLRKMMGEKGWRAVQRRYNWEIDVKEMMKSINRVTSHIPAR